MNHNPIAIFGEVLFDQFPDGQHILGGAPFNVAWHLQAFAQQACFISRIGNDPNAAKIRSAMSAWGMACAQVQTDNTHPTGVVQITLNDGQPSYHILDRQAYDFIAPPATPQALSCIYHGTLAVRHSTSAQTLRGLLAAHPGPVFVDVNLREPWWQASEVNAWLTGADWVKLNEEELWLLAPAATDLKDTMQAFVKQHQLTVLVVTRGSQGAVAITAQGEWLEVSPHGKIKIADTVGAGDAFASVLLLGLHHGWPLSQTMARAQDFASAIVTQKGATVQDKQFYQPFITAWQL